LKRSPRTLVKVEARLATVQRTHAFEQIPKYGHGHHPSAATLIANCVPVECIE
jgi:hypothetical protein